MASPVPEERKLVTVLFADLAGSTELATGRDPEQLRNLLAAFFEEMAQQIHAFGGTVEKYAGDAIIALRRDGRRRLGRRGPRGPVAAIAVTCGTAHADSDRRPSNVPASCMIHATRRVAEA